MREYLVAVVAKSLRLRYGMGKKDRESAAMASRLASPEAKHAAELAELNERIRMLEADRAGARKARRGAGGAQREDQDARGRQGRP